MSNEQIKQNIEQELHFRQYARIKLSFFILYTFKNYKLSPFHKTYCEIIQAFLDKKIRKLIISVPPQHGKSEVATRRLPAMLLGQNPAYKIAIVSYSTGKSWRFGRQIKQVMKSPEYKNVFPNTRLPEPRDPVYMNSADVVDIPAGKETGNLYFVGRGGGLTGEPVDILIMDDLYKNAMEAYSPIIRDSVIDWYDTVADSRLHNDSQQIIVSTRWHENDLIGYIKRSEEVEQLTTFDQLKNPNPDTWYMINFEALKESSETELDPRKQGAPLYPAKHSQKKLLNTRKRLVKEEPEKWEGLYQGNPRPIKGLLYQGGFKEYDKLPELYEKCAYVDVADTGTNYLCVICYGVGIDGYIYALDIYYTAEKQEITEPETANTFIRNELNSAHIESNAGGRAFARNIDRIIREKEELIDILPFHQAQNKESRIITHAADCMRKILFPVNWKEKWPVFAGAILNFRKKFTANDFNDAPDCLTGVFEKAGIEDEEIIIATG